MPLSREGLVSASVWALLLRAALAAGASKPERAIALLREASELAEKGDMALCVALARHRLGTLLGGDEGRALIGQADQWLASRHLSCRPVDRRYGGELGRLRGQIGPQGGQDASAAPETQPG